MSTPSQNGNFWHEQHPANYEVDWPSRTVNDNVVDWLAMRFARLLARIRSERGMTQKDLGRALGHADGSVVSKYERGEVLPTPKTVAQIEQILGVEDGRLMTARQDDYDAARSGGRTEGQRRIARLRHEDELTPEQVEEVNRFIEFILQRDAEKR